MRACGIVDYLPVVLFVYAKDLLHFFTLIMPFLVKSSLGI
jgi:hypothetical protein